MMITADTAVPRMLFKGGSAVLFVVSATEVAERFELARQCGGEAFSGIVKRLPVGAPEGCQPLVE